MRGKACKRCKKLKERLRIALAQKTAAWSKTADTEAKQRRAETLLVGYKNVLLEAIRRTQPRNTA